MLSLIAVFGILPASRARLRRATRRPTRRPPTPSSARHLGSATSSPLAVVISGIGALNGWTMICAEMPLAAAKDGLFPQACSGPLSEQRRAGVRHHRLHGAGLASRS